MYDIEERCSEIESFIKENSGYSEDESSHICNTHKFYVYREGKILGILAYIESDELVVNPYLIVLEEKRRTGIGEDIVKNWVQYINREVRFVFFKSYLVDMYTRLGCSIETKDNSFIGTYKPKE